MIPITPELILFGFDILRRGAQAIRESIEAAKASGELSAEDAQKYLDDLDKEQDTSAYQTDAQAAVGNLAAGRGVTVTSPGTPRPLFNEGEAPPAPKVETGEEPTLDLGHPSGNAETPQPKADEAAGEDTAG